MPVPVSFLDLTPVGAGSTSTRALHETVELARLADRLGYGRYWFAEHHNSAGLAYAAPEVMIAHIAAQTRYLRVGAGGVMLPNHAPLRIAEAFRLLEALHPGRVDLGLGRAPGTDTLTAFAMRRSRQAMTGNDYPELLAELLAFDDGSFPADHPFRAIRPVPVDVPLPPIFLLGSSGFSARLAAQAGLGFAFAAHINRPAAVPALRDYRDSFVPSARYPEPRAILTVSVTVGDSPEHAQALSRINDLFLLRLATGQLDRRPSREEALAYHFTDAERAALAAMPLNYLAGDATGVHAQVVDLLEASGADELMLTSMLPDADDRRRAVAAMAAAFGLAEREDVAPPGAATDGVGRTAGLATVG
ncbi:MAG: LLM class flavin-dependent oxidoreductase [Chloroflexota bacterium]|nr:LLM class flavin-dependent oxidoreductase [Chloroflexota bacterium]